MRPFWFSRVNDEEDCVRGSDNSVVHGIRIAIPCSTGAEVGMTSVRALLRDDEVFSSCRKPIENRKSEDLWRVSSQP